MPHSLFKLFTLLAQASPAFDDPHTPDPDRGMRLSDLQHGLRTQLDGDKSEVHYRNLLLIIMLGVVLIGVLLNLRQRRKEGGPPDSPSALTRELTRHLKLPFTSRLLLLWVARSANIPAAALLISRELFDSNVAAWTRQPTFGILRHWGARRLQHLQSLLFDPAQA